MVKVKVKQFLYRHGWAPRASGGPGSQISRQSAYEGGKVVSPTHGPPLPPRKYTCYSFLLAVESTPGPMKNSNDNYRNRNRDFPVSSAVPQPTVPPRAPILKHDAIYFRRQVYVYHIRPRHITCDLHLAITKF
jgi:hypothetical protein